MEVIIYECERFLNPVAASRIGCESYLNIIGQTRVHVDQVFDKNTLDLVEYNIFLLRVANSGAG